MSKTPFLFEKLNPEPGCELGCENVTSLPDICSKEFPKTRFESIGVIFTVALKLWFASMNV